MKENDVEKALQEISREEERIRNLKRQLEETRDRAKRSRDAEPFIEVLQNQLLVVQKEQARVEREIKIDVRNYIAMLQAHEKAAIVAVQEACLEETKKLQEKIVKLKRGDGDITDIADIADGGRAGSAGSADSADGKERKEQIPFRLQYLCAHKPKHFCGVNLAKLTHPGIDPPLIEHDPSRYTYCFLCNSYSKKCTHSSKWRSHSSQYKQCPAPPYCEVCGDILPDDMEVYVCGACKVRVHPAFELI